MSTTISRKGFASCIPSSTASSEMQQIALKAHNLVQTKPYGAPFRGFCLLDLTFAMRQEEVPAHLAEVMPCSYRCGMSLSEAAVLAQIAVDSEYRCSPTVFTFSEASCLPHSHTLHANTAHSKVTRAELRLPVLTTIFRERYCCAVSLGGNYPVPDSRVNQFNTTNFESSTGYGMMLFLARLGSTLLVVLFVPHPPPPRSTRNTRQHVRCVLLPRNTTGATNAKW